MLLCILGVSTALMHATVSLFKSALDESPNGVTLIAANTVDGLRDALAAVRDGRPGGHVMFVSDSPDDKLVDLFDKARLPVLVVMEDFEASVLHVLGARGFPVPETVRFISQGYATLAPLVASDRTVTLGQAHAALPAVSLLDHVFEFHGLPAGEVEHILGRLGLDARESMRDYADRCFPGAAAPNDLRPEDWKNIQWVASSYQHIARGEPLRASEWPTELLLDWDRPGQFLKGPLHLTGPARFIVCGPYLHLPIGAWRATFVINVEANWSGNRLALDLFSGGVICGITADLPKEGHFGFDLDFEVRAAYLPLEARIQILEGAIEGTFELVSARFVNRNFPPDPGTSLRPAKGRIVDRQAR